MLFKRNSLEFGLRNTDIGAERGVSVGPEITTRFTTSGGD